MAIFLDKFMETKRELISKLLAEWNPLSVPVKIADTEYEDYVEIIIDNMMSKKRLKECLTKILVDEMGLHVTSPLFLNDVEKICDAIYKITVSG